MNKTSKKETSNKWRIVTNIVLGLILIVLYMLTYEVKCIEYQLKNNDARIQENTSVLSQVRNEQAVRADTYIELRHCTNDEEDEEQGVPDYDFFTTDDGTLNIHPFNNMYEAKKEKILLYTSEDEEVPSEIEFHFSNELLLYYTNYQLVAISPSGEEQILKRYEPEWYTGPDRTSTVWQFKLCEQGTYIIDMRNLDDTNQHQYFSLIW